MVMDLWKEYRGGAAPFLSHISGTHDTYRTSLVMLALITWLRSCPPGFSTAKLLFPLSILYSFEESHQVQLGCVFSISDCPYLKIIRLLKDTYLVFHAAAIGWRRVTLSPLDSDLSLQVTTVPLSSLHSFQLPAWPL